MPRFTIRDLLWLTVVVALAVALWQSRAALKQERKVVAEWTSRAEAALRAIQTRVPAANWHDSGFVVTETQDSGANYIKFYPGK